MASLSASSLILFIAAIGIAAGVSGVMVDSVGGISESITTHGDSVEEQLDTDITIISDTGSDAIYDDTDGTVTVLVKNTGDRSLPTDPDLVDVVFDGEYVVPSSTAITVVSDGGKTWKEGEVIELVIDLDGSLYAGEHRATVIVDGDEEVLRFYV
ncbi:flagellar protein G [Natronomonas gomsonensis]|uniref:flagellar protein G n=1 Tax=Natronomonas gomsonensis TaxID=1046043 RepID=UPI0015C12A6A|nr:flagellar protein G [Natronomonas gomsonensis]